MFRYKHAHSGMTMIELVVTIVILAISLTGITMAIRGGISRSADTTLQVRTVALAQAYLDEILSKRFDEKSRNNGIPPCRALPVPSQCSATLGPEAGETRASYDDVDDYHELDEGDDPLNPLQDVEGNPRLGYENFRVRVNVRYIDVGPGGAEENLHFEPLSLDLNDQFDAKLITVTVSHRSQPTGFDFSAYKANF